MSSEERTPGCDGELVAGKCRALRARWRTASLAAGWPFPSDWASEAVERVCEAVVGGADPLERLGELGAARAEAGVGLAGTLQDLAALHAAMTGDHDGLVSADPDAVPAHLVRATALGWADVVARLAVGREVQDPLTGLTTLSYLRTRLHELYRLAGASGRTPDADHALVEVSLDVRGEDRGYPAMMAMVLAADVLRAVFDAGETVSLARSSTALVLAPRGRSTTDRCARLGRLIERRIADDPALLMNGPVRVREVALPPAHEQACALITSMA
ncbi:hypothetical protein [Saccharopolyspora erythraea]|uniref:hypothetical protein n=1 Tax=Saccharopolyspora erythraea TaxID=1836 RepID=UPI002011D25E|nr:hypothetical protein [Saccharopolyspora erythraea]